MGLGVLEGTKPSQVDGFEVGRWDDQGEHRLPLADAVSVPFDGGRPVRSFPSYRGQRHFPGLYWSSTTGGHVGFESRLERDHAILLIRGGCSDDSFMDFRAGVIALGCQRYQRVAAEPDSLAAHPDVVQAANVRDRSEVLFHEDVNYAASGALSPSSINASPPKARFAGPASSGSRRL
ncbi:DUF4240 domain-containing protein [Streptomyces europaeiscabiei]|uniref:DUF4240 domain-containing protein n=1 Tax=Streptomyces europaeiscabiei TaxID=146819 RepID=UPI0038D4F941